jgi:hypothetical protein
MYYINPLTDRVINSSGKIYQKLKQRRFKLEPDHCLYNNTTARRCMLSLLKRYPNIYLSSSYTSIPATYTFNSNAYPKLQNLRAFIEKNPGTGVASGYITKDGTLFKLNKEIELKPNDVIVQTASDTDSNVLLSKLDDSQVISPNTQEMIEQHVKDSEPISDSINIVYNPVKNDFIPVKGDNISLSEIVNEYNNTTEAESTTEPEPEATESELETTTESEPEATELETEPEATELETEPEATTESEPEATEPETEITEPEPEITEPEPETPYRGLQIITDKDDNVIGFI